MGINKFKILSTCYQHDVEIFLKIVGPYFPKGQELDNNNLLKICPPTGKSAPLSSVTELSTPWRFKSTLDEPHNCFYLPPLSTASSRRNLARLISNEPSNCSKREEIPIIL